jgi:hypothetical protein
VSSPYLEGIFEHFRMMRPFQIPVQYMMVVFHHGDPEIMKILTLPKRRGWCIPLGFGLFKQLQDTP